MSSAELVTVHIFLWASVALILAFLIFGRQRSYILLLGVTFLGVDACLLTGDKPFLRGFCAALTLGVLVMAFIEGGRDSKERLAKFKAEQRDREEAFAEFQMALIKKEQEGQEQAEKDNA